MVLERSSFRVRGDVIDVYPAEHEKKAIRLSLFDDELESITEFDPLTGQLLRELQRFTFYPKTHYVTPKERVSATVDLIKAEMLERVAYFQSVDKLIEAQRIEQRCRYDMEMMLELAIVQVLKITLEVFIKSASRPVAANFIGLLPGKNITYD